MIILDLIERLLEAKRNGEILKIIYNGGSQPGTIRAIFPLNIIDNKVVAKCLASNEKKEFVLDKIEICEDQNIIPNYDPKFKALPKYNCLEDIYNRHCQELEKAGWLVKLYENALKLYQEKIFKNGNKKLIEKISLLYIDTGIRTHIDIDGNEVNETIVYKNPWYVDGRQYKFIDKAVERFLELANTNK